MTHISDSSPATPRRISGIIRTFVDRLLAWDRVIAIAESAAKGAVSGTAVVQEVLQRGVVGTGNSGTKGVGRAPHEEREVRTDPVGSALYRALSPAARRVADAVVSDGRGDQIACVQIGRAQYPLSLYSRIGIRLASDAQLEKWAKKFLSRDSQPAIAESEGLGEKALLEAATEWHKLDNELAPR